MNLRKILSGTAALAASILVLAASLRMQAMPYPIFENLSFAGWLALSASIVTVIAIPGLVLLGIWQLTVALPGFLARRLASEPNPTLLNTPTPAAAPAPDIDAEWADIERQIQEKS